MKKLRIACIGGWHSLASKFARIVSEYPECELVAVWDGDAARGRALAAERGCRYEADYAALVRDETLDGFLFTCEIARHAELIVPAARAGKHIFCEKPLALTKADAEAIRDAVKAGNVHFVLSDPIIHAPVAALRHLMDAGTLGEVTGGYFRLVNYRAIDGALKPAYPPYHLAEAGGGVMADLGGHMVHAVQYFMGRPESVASVCVPLTPEGKASGAEENVSALFRFADGRCAVGETGWISPDNQLMFRLYGTKGEAFANYHEAHYRLCGDSEWKEIPPESFPPEGVYPLRCFVETMLGTLPDEAIGTTESTCRCVNIDQAVELSEITDALYRAQRAGVAL